MASAVDGGMKAASEHVVVATLKAGFENKGLVWSMSENEQRVVSVPQSLALVGIPAVAQEQGGPVSY